MRIKHLLECLSHLRPKILEPNPLKHFDEKSAIRFQPIHCKFKRQLAQFIMSRLIRNITPLMLGAISLNTRSTRADCNFSSSQAKRCGLR